MMSIFKKDPTMDTEKVQMEVTKREALGIFSERYEDKKTSLGTWLLYIAAAVMVLLWLFIADSAPSYSVCLPIAAMVMLFVNAVIGIKKNRKVSMAAYSEHRG